ncbi:unnamed protein product [Rotaria sordida]|uniref:Uncharacterized protein n=1 Tax=Rotaria sordida TaxID=392033 RepID=A0A815I4C9_9BILA|nr:unnamed protein product [Rotaria sordida]CAF1606806.1 unnamed protein product [Rotaria sordida]
MNITINIIILSVIILYFIEWLYMIHSCEHQVFESYTNRSRWIELDLCFNSYASFGLLFIINKCSFGLLHVVDKFSFSLLHVVDKFSFGLLHVVDTFSFGLSRIYDEPFTIIMIVLVGLFAGGVINRSSDLGITMMELFHTIRHDMSIALNELWSSIKNAIMTVYRSITLVKIIELSFLGLILKSLSELPPLLFKTFDKTAKL